MRNKNPVAIIVIKFFISIMRSIAAKYPLQITINAHKIPKNTYLNTLPTILVRIRENIMR